MTRPAPRSPLAIRKCCTLSRDGIWCGRRDVAVLLLVAGCQTGSNTKTTEAKKLQRRAAYKPKSRAEEVELEALNPADRQTNITHD